MGSDAPKADFLNCSLTSELGDQVGSGNKGNNWSPRLRFKLIPQHASVQIWPQLRRAHNKLQLNPLTCLERVYGKATAERAPALNCQFRQWKCNFSDFTLQFNLTHSSRGNSCSLDQKNRLTRIINILQADRNGSGGTRETQAALYQPERSKLKIAFICAKDLTFWVHVQSHWEEQENEV